MSKWESWRSKELEESNDQLETNDNTQCRVPQNPVCLQRDGSSLKMKIMPFNTILTFRVVRYIQDRTSR